MPSTGRGFGRSRASRFLEECDAQLAAEYPMERVVGSTITFVLKVK